MLAVQSEGKRKALHAIQVRSSGSSKRETRLPLSKQHPSQESNVESKTSKRKLQALERGSEINETKSTGLRVFEDETKEQSDDVVGPIPSKKQRLSSDEPIETIFNKETTDKCQECLRRKHEEERKLMTSDEAPLEYWKQLAEQRREALDEALKENESLHDQIEVLETENSELRVMAEQAKQLAEILELLESRWKDVFIVVVQDYSVNRSPFLSVFEKII